MSFPFSLFPLSLTGRTHERFTIKQKEKIKRVKDEKYKEEQCTIPDLLLYALPPPHLLHTHIEGTKLRTPCEISFSILNETVAMREKRNRLGTRGKCRVILSLFVVNVSYLHYGCT